MSAQKSLIFLMMKRKERMMAVFAITVAMISTVFYGSCQKHEPTDRVFSSDCEFSSGVYSIEFKDSSTNFTFNGRVMLEENAESEKVLSGYAITEFDSLLEHYLDRIEWKVRPESRDLNSPGVVVNTIGWNNYLCGLSIGAGDFNQDLRGDYLELWVLEQSIAGLTGTYHIGISGPEYSGNFTMNKLN